MSQNMPFCLCPFKCKLAGDPAPFSEEGRASKANALAHRSQQTISRTELRKQSTRIAFIWIFFNRRIALYDRSGSTWRQHQWKQAETMVALATLALQSAKKLFQKGNLKTKYEALTLSASDVRARSIALSESDFAKIQPWNDPRLWGSPVENNWHDFIDFFSVHFLQKWNLTTVSSAAQMEGVCRAPMSIGASQNTTLVLPLWRCHCISPVMTDRCFSLRPVSMLIGQRVSQMGGTFPYSDVYLGRNLESLVLRDCLWFIVIIKQWVGGFLPLQAGCFHTLQPHNTCVQTPYKRDFCIIGPL